MDTSKSLEMQSTVDNQEEGDRMATGLLSQTEWVSRTETFVSNLEKSCKNFPFSEHN
jgi:hypothetical protein